eukprot:scaffold79432_cov34-Tisochrysis_lutea.AAC.2
MGQHIGRGCVSSSADTLQGTCLRYVRRTAIRRRPSTEHPPRFEMILRDARAGARERDGRVEYISDTRELSLKGYGHGARHAPILSLCPPLHAPSTMPIQSLLSLSWTMT